MEEKRRFGLKTILMLLYFLQSSLSRSYQYDMLQKYGNDIKYLSEFNLYADYKNTTSKKYLEVYSRSQDNGQCNSNFIKVISQLANIQGRLKSMRIP